MEPGDVFGLLIFVAGVAGLIAYMARVYFRYKEKQLEAETTLAAEKAAQYAASNAALEARLRVLEKIVTDGGVETAAQIEALRDRPVMRTETKQ